MTQVVRSVYLGQPRVSLESTHQKTKVGSWAHCSPLWWGALPVLEGTGLSLMHLWVQVFARHHLWLHVLGVGIDSCKTFAYTQTGMHAGYFSAFWPALSSFHS